MERKLTLDRAIDIGIANEVSDRNNTRLSWIHSAIQRKRLMVSTKEVYRRKILNLASKFVGIVVVSRNHVQRLARNVCIAVSPTISKTFAVLNVMAGVQALEIVDGVPGVLFKWSIQSILSDKMRIYLLSMRLRPSQERKVKFTAQWISTANQLKLKLTLALNVISSHSIYVKGSAGMRRLIIQMQCCWFPIAGHANYHGQCDFRS